MVDIFLFVLIKETSQYLRKITSLQLFNFDTSSIACFNRFIINDQL